MMKNKTDMRSFLKASAGIYSQLPNMIDFFCKFS